MASSDISLQIQEAITSIIETSLNGSSNVSILKTYKTTNQSLNGLNVLVVNVSFAFEKLTTNLRFVLPAKTATMIAHAMLMEDTPPLDTISEDIADAMKESITQICGTLQTVINSSGLEDLGKSSFSIGNFEIIDGLNYQVVNTFLLLKLSCGENTYDYFIDFEENILPFIEELSKSDSFIFEDEQAQIEAPSNDVEEIIVSSEEDYTPEESANSEQKEILGEEDKDNEIKEKEEDNNPPLIKEDENIVEEGVSSEDEEKLAKVNKKNKIIKMVVIALATILGIVIIGFSVMLYMGVFDKEEIPVEKVKLDTNINKPSEESLVIADIKNKQIDFKLSMIDENRINKKLQFLTKYEILEEDVLAKFKKAEEERLYKLKMAKLEEFALNNKEESLYKSNDGNMTGNNINDEQRKNRFDDENLTASNLPTTEQNDKMMQDELLMLVKVDPKEYKKYKEVITKNKQDSTQISICKDQKGVVNVYVGPIYLKTVINNILNEAKKVDKNSKKDMGLVSIKRGEFNKMCDF
jgi:chemotaxis protein CheY-P-specific phosphatase CheC